MLGKVLLKWEILELKVIAQELELPIEEGHVQQAVLCASHLIEERTGNSEILARCSNQGAHEEN